MGYIIIDRSIIDWRWYTERGMRHLFEHLILMANFKDGMWHKISVKRGQLITTRCRLSRETGLTEKEVRTGLERLQRTGEIIIKATNQYSLITICNYDTYQGQDNRRSQSKANESPTKVQGEATIEKWNKERREDIDSSLRSESPSSATTGKDDEVNLHAFMDFFNRTIQEHGAQIPTITQIAGQRRQRLLARVKEYGKEALRKAIINAVTAPFLNGASEKVFVASLDWILRPNNFPKVLEGNYNHVVSNTNLNNHGTGNNNGYRSREDIIKGAMRNAVELIAEGQQPKTEIPIV